MSGSGGEEERWIVEISANLSGNERNCLPPASPPLLHMTNGPASLSKRASEIARSFDFRSKSLADPREVCSFKLHPVHRIVAKSILDAFPFSLSIQSVYIFNPPRIESILHLAGGRVFIPWSFSRFLESSWSTVIEFPVLKIGRQDYER